VKERKKSMFTATFGRIRSYILYPNCYLACTLIIFETDSRESNIVVILILTWCYLAPTVPIHNP
jgi:hypothetical protein